HHDLQRDAALLRAVRLLPGSLPHRLTRSHSPTPGGAPNGGVAGPMRQRLLPYVLRTGRGNARSAGSAVHTLRAERPDAARILTPREVPVPRTRRRYVGVDQRRAREVVETDLIATAGAHRQRAQAAAHDVVTSCEGCCGPVIGHLVERGAHVG